MTDQLTDPGTDGGFVTDSDVIGSDVVLARWEPCLAFAPEVTDSQVCGDCGWLHDDHRRPADVRQLPVRAPRVVQPGRLAS